MTTNNSISSRTHRLNKLIVGRSDNLNCNVHSNNTLNREILLDAFEVLYNECNKDALKKNDRNISEFSKKYQNAVSETKKQRVNINDFKIKDLIGKGFFGEVHLAIENITRDVYAIKKIPKSSFAQSKEERNIMAISRSDWIPKLQYAFQDNTHLYLVMEYLPGGDLFSLMIRNNTFPEDVIQFYLAEITLALNALHTLGFVHRDVKPGNVLLDRFGHLKLADFGSAISIEKDGHVVSFTPAGTPDYIAPELLQPIHAKRPMKTTYNETCDFWSMGIIAYEMLTEKTPFHSHNVHDTYNQILSYVDGTNTILHYPSDVEISNDLRDLIDHLVTRANNRLTYKKIIKHKFFRSIEWSNLRQQVPPIIPTLNGEDDTSNFEEDLKKSRRNNTFDTSTSSSVKNNNFSGFDLPFVGFSYVCDDIANDGTNFSFDSSSQEVNRLTTQLKSLQKTIDTQMMDISSLQKNLSEYQKKSAQATSIEKILGITKEEMNALKEKLKEKTVEIANCRTQIKTLKNSLKIEEEQRVKNDANIADVLNSTYQKWERSKKQSEQNYEKQISEKKSEVLAIQEKLKVCGRELESKSAECIHLQETIDRLMDRLKSTKNQSDTEINAHARKHRESNVHFEGQLRELRSRLQTQIEAKNMADDEIQTLKSTIEENNQRFKLISDQKNKLDETNSKLNRQLNKEIDENRSLHDEKLKLSHTIMDLQSKIEELSSQAHKSDGTASLYCSLESISSEIEAQLKKDLELAKESENEQRLRANSLEETVKRLEAAIERVTNTGFSGVEVMLERQNEKLEEKLCTVQEQATIEKQASRTAHLQLWKNEKELDTIKREKRRLEHEVKKLQSDADELTRKVHENKIIAQNREERITELQNDLTARKNELQIERSRWTDIEKERNKEKVLIVNQNTKIHKLEIDLDECKSKMSLFEQQKNTLMAENQHLTQKLRKEMEKLENTMEKLVECEQNYEALNKNNETLKSVCSLMEMQLVELEEMYNTQLDQNKEKSVSIDKLWDDIRERDAKLLKLQQDMTEEKTQNSSMKQKSSEMTTEVARLTNTLTECQQNVDTLQQDLLEKADYLMKSEELIEVQKEEIQSLQRVNHNLDREIIIVKEENSKLLTELYISKENYQKLHFDYSSLNENYTDLRMELEQLNGTMSELNKYQTQREIKSEATQAQYKKLIDYLQKRVDELTQKKKKTLAEVLFGASNSSKKENIPPIVSHAQKDVEVDKSNACHKSHSIKTTKSNTINDRASKKKDKNPIKSTVNSSNSSKEVAKIKTKISSPENMNSGTHLFERTSYSNTVDMSEACLVCKKHFVSDTVYQCKKCNASVHQYCRGSNMKCNSQPEVSDGPSNDDDISLLDVPQKPRYMNDVILKESDMSPALEILCIHEIDNNVLLLGCTSGLKAYNITNKKLIHIANIDNIINMAIVTDFSKSILISENGKKLLQCDLRHLQTRANASVCLNTGMEYVELNLPFVMENTPTSDLWRFAKIFDNTDRDQEISEPIAIAATSTQIVILRYDIEIKHFKAIRALDTASPVQSIYYTPFTAIVSSDKFFEIDLNTLISEEFIDLSDTSLVHTLSSRPLSTFAINTQEYLMCFKDFGIFVNEFGCRTRPTEINWLKNAPQAFAYRAPILYIFSADGLQLMHISKTFDETDEDEKQAVQTFIEMKHSKFGTTCGKHGVYIINIDDNFANAETKQIVRVDGTKVLYNFEHFDSVSPKKMRKSGSGADGSAPTVALPSESAPNTNDEIPMDEDFDPASLYEDEEGGYRVGDIYIPPPIKPYCSSESQGARLIITQIMNTNFKSYAGEVPLGPFCHRFHAIIGPNGSGKSNVIDSMLFVFGYRSNKIRCKKLSLMIHHSKKCPDADSCRVAIHFAQIEDNTDGSYRIIEGSEFIIAREAHRNNSSYYTIDGRRVHFKEVAALLKKHNVDLDHNRFLILQGEVESIAMMKPKAQNENECGHLEYLEDIIGTTRYKEPLEKIHAHVEILSEERTEKHNRCKMAERELNDLKAPMEEAVAYLKLENDLTRTKNKETQLHIYKTKESLERCTAELEEKTQNLKDHDIKYEAIIKERTEKEQQIKEEMANYERIIKKKEEHEQMKKNADSKYDEIQSSMDETNKRRKQIGTTLKKKEAELEELKRVPTKNQKEITECEKKVERFTKEKDEANEILQRNLLKLQDKIKPLTEKKQKLEAELAKVQIKQDAAKSELDVIENELKLAQQTESTEKKKFEVYKSSLEKSKETLETRRTELAEAEKIIPSIKKDIAQCEQEIHVYKTKEKQLQTEVANLRSVIEEKSHMMRQARSNNKVLEHLMRKKIEGEIPGVLGRLGDLGGIDKKYDVAISTCCGRLDNIVVDTVETAEQCINSLKRDDVGRATFIALEKIEHYAEYAGPIQTPENASRLYDLVRIEDERLVAAFYFALRDTLVANDMDQATRIAYGAKRYRVVTLKGDVIETSGTMSGGGRTQFRGKMGEQVKTKTSVSHNTSIGGNTTTEGLDEIRAKAQKIQDEINHAQQIQGEKGKTLAQLKARLPREEANLKRFKTDIATYAQQIPGLEIQLEDQRQIMEESRSDPKKVAELNREIDNRKKTFDKCSADTKQLQDQVDAVNQEVKIINEDQIGSVEKSIQNIEKQIKKLSNQATKLKVEIAASERNVKKAEENIATMKEDIATAQSDLLRMNDERAQAEKDASEIQKRLQEIIKEISQTQNGSSDTKKEVIALQKQESDAKLQRVELEQTLQKIEKLVRDLKASIPYYKKKLEPLKLHNIPNEDAPQPLKTYSDEELATYAIDEIQYRIEVFEGELKAKTPNLNVIDEYQKKLDVYMDRIKVLEDITAKRNEMRKLFEDIKKRRYNEFMNGFNIITHKLKEMYAMITQGGNAELELVDSMDPFSEGISFSVRPHRKSWKNISNLSGGEKTLSSLALVFALHYYKPSPLYFMDEIDAALDFKNVSIVANYIRDRTKNAQFIIISLRSNMFELSDFLTGIYKVDDCTDSLTIENVPPPSIGTASQQMPSSQRTTSDNFMPSQSIFPTQSFGSQQLPDQSSSSLAGNETTKDDEINEAEVDK
ncbi:uncharacterized protein LOC116341786 [Contarinia nasturtii]|uniref:uncharacterized protein LOC116341786 n=1 Tax=Contarinia nasturtii TaxID=265458 RepID=UPI0012D4AD09|nr:uncharacterized protein LOC116341786 [Contarinia nasturtii]